MKKAIFTVFLVLLGFMLVACKPQVSDPTETGETPVPTETPVLDTIAPIFFGVVDVVLNIGDSFDPLQGITAIDDIDGNITSRIVVTGAFNLNVAGIYQLTYSVSDSAGNTATMTRQVIIREKPQSELFITNGDFSEPLSGTWTHWAGEGGSSTVQIIDGVLHYVITATGNQWWSNQFSQPNLTIPQGKGFILEFDAKADSPRAMVVKLENVVYFGYIDEAVQLTTEWQTFRLEFFMTDPTITNGKLIFGGGTTIGYTGESGALTTIYIDNVKFIEKEPEPDTVPPTIIGATDKVISINEPFNPLTGITVSDNMDIHLSIEDLVITGTVDITKPGEYVLTYTLTDASGNQTVVTRTITVLSGLAPSTWLVVNGDFSTDQLAPLPQPAETGWGWHGNGIFSAIIEKGVAKIDIRDLGTTAFGVQFYQQNRIIEQGRIYRITFDAKADIPRPIQIALESGTSRRYDEIVNLTTEWVTYVIEIEHVLPGYTNGKFAFFLGLVGTTSVPTVVYLDNVTVETIGEIIDTKAPMLFGVDDFVMMKNATFDPLLGVTVFDAYDKLLTKDDIIVEGTVDTSTVGQYTLTYTIKDASMNEATYTRIIHVKEKEDMLSSTLVLVNSNFSTDQSIPHPQPATAGWGWHGNGVFSVEIKDGIMTQIITNVGTVPHGTQFYQQNLIVETQALYRIRFDAKMDIARSIRVSLERGTTAETWRIVQIGTEWATYEIYMEVPNTGYTNAKFAFFAGLVEPSSPATTFYLDNIIIELVGYPLDKQAPLILGVNDVTLPVGDMFNPLAGVTLFDLYDKSLLLSDIVVTGQVNTAVSGFYMLTYEVTDRSGNKATYQRQVTVEKDGIIQSSWTVINGDFEDDQLESVAAGSVAGWRWHNHNTGGSFVAKIEDGVAQIDVHQIGHHPYGVQFYLQNRIIEQDRIYRITFDAKADVARPIQVILEQGTTRRFTINIDITTEWKTYTVEFQHTMPGYSNGKFGFFLGNAGAGSVPTTIYLDNVNVQGISQFSPDTEKPIIKGVNDTVVLKGMMFDPLLGISVTDNRSSRLTPQHIVVTGSVDTSTVGQYTLTYQITDQAGNEATYTRIIHVREKEDMLSSTWILKNPEFTEDQLTSDLNNGWDWRTSGTGAGSTSIQNGIATVNVTNIGTVPHGYQFNHYFGITEMGGYYRITFVAKADQARSIKVVLENAAIFTREFDVNLDLTTEWATYTIEFVHMGTGLTNGKLGFFLGNVDAQSVPTTFYFDSVTIELIGYHLDQTKPLILNAHPINIEVGTPFDPLQGVQVFDLYDRTLTTADLEVTGLVDVDQVGFYTLTYTLSDRSGNTTVWTREIGVGQQGIMASTWLINNGDFSVDQAETLPNAAAGAEVLGWRWHNHNTGGSVVAKIENGIAEIEVINIGHHPYGVQFYQQNRVIEQNRIYRITFDAKADVARPIQVILEQGTTRRFTINVDITTEWATYVIEFKHTMPGYSNGKFGFFLGNAGAGSVPTTIYLDNVNVQGISQFSPDTEKPIIKGVNDTVVLKGMMFDPLLGISVTDNRSSRLTPQHIVVTGSVDTSTVGQYTLTYQITDQAGNEATYTRIIHVREKEDMLSSTWILKNPEFTEDQLTSDLNNGWDWRTSGTGAGSTSIQNGIATVNVTNIGTVPHGYQFNHYFGITEMGGYYRITFVAKADQARSIKVVLENAAIFTREFDVNLDLTTEWATYTIEFVHMGTGLTNGKLGFFLGNVDAQSVPTTFYFDSVTIELIGYHLDQTKPLILNAHPINIEVGTPFDPLQGVQVFDLYDRTLTTADLEVTGLINTQAIGTYELTYTLSDRQGNVTTWVRVITVS